MWSLRVKVCVSLNTQWIYLACLRWRGWVCANQMESDLSASYSKSPVCCYGHSKQPRVHLPLMRLERVRFARKASRAGCKFGSGPPLHKWWHTGGHNYSGKVFASCLRWRSLWWGPTQKRWIGGHVAVILVMGSLPVWAWIISRSSVCAVVLKPNSKLLGSCNSKAKQELF